MNKGVFPKDDRPVEKLQQHTTVADCLDWGSATTGEGRADLLKNGAIEKIVERFNFASGGKNPCKCRVGGGPGVL